MNKTAKKILEKAKKTVKKISNNYSISLNYKSPLIEIYLEGYGEGLKEARKVYKVGNK